MERKIQRSRQAAPLYCVRLESIQVEIDVDYQLHCDRMALVHCGPELVLSHGFHRLLIQAHAEVANHMDVLWVSLAVNDELNRNDALKIGTASLIGEFGIHRVHELRSGDTSTYAHNSATVTAAAADSDAIAAARANTASRALTKA